jgi:hypothetical protein
MFSSHLNTLGWLLTLRGEMEANGSSCVRSGSTVCGWWVREENM